MRLLLAAQFLVGVTGNRGATYLLAWPAVPLAVLTAVYQHDRRPLPGERPRD